MGTQSKNFFTNQSSDILQRSQNRPTGDRGQMVQILKYDNPGHKIKLKIRQFQVMGKSTGQINKLINGMSVANRCNHQVLNPSKAWLKRYYTPNEAASHAVLQSTEFV